MSYDYDVLIIGAGISGINQAQRLKSKNPNETFIILESREAIGGTWDLFNYPGLRSDSDLYTLGFAWKAWNGGSVIAQKRVILNYMTEACDEAGLWPHIQFRSRVTQSSWSSADQFWTVDVDVGSEEKTTKQQYTAKFVVFGSGLYDYREGKPAAIPGLDNFKGQVIHPQFWPKDTDCTDKRVVIVGSGATAVTILPVIAETAKQVTMIQRSPGYIIPIFSVDDLLTRIIKRFLPLSAANTLIRWRWVCMTYLLFFVCRNWPDYMRNWMIIQAKDQLPKDYPIDPNFTPAYMPGDQRICFVPDADFYKAICAGQANVKTGTIKTLTAKTVVLENGTEVEADIVITATGLKLLFGGDIEILVDGKPYNMGGAYLWKGALLNDLPNAVIVFGYTNASYTLGADATAHLVCRVLDVMKKKKAGAIIPRLSEKTKSQFTTTTAIIPLKSSYVKEAQSVMPRAGTHGPWKARSNYFADMSINLYGNMNDLEYVPRHA